MRRGAWLAFGGLAAGLVVHGCMYPEFDFSPRPGSGTSTATGTGGAATGTATGTGGDGGSGTGTATGTATSGGTGGAATGTGSGGSGGVPCDLWGASPCGAGEKCGVIDPGVAATYCVPAGDHAAYSWCDSDDQCMNHTWCDYQTGVCKPLCQAPTGCTSGADCVDATYPGGVVLAFDVCTAYCDPRNAQPCSQAHGATNCVLTADGFDCVRSEGKGHTSSCGESYECAATFGCYDCWFGLTDCCERWCDGDSDCPWNAPTCRFFAPTIEYGATELGTCILL